MAPAKLALVEGGAEGDLGVLIESWKRDLEGPGDKSPNTVKLYIGTALQLHAFLVAEKRPATAASITTADLEAYLVAVRERTSRSTAATRYAHLVQMFRWLKQEGEIEANPMTDIKRPKPEERPVAVISLEDIKLLLATCKGPGFEEKRDTAIIRLLLDGGVRRSELANVKFPEDVDLERKRFYVYGKGRRERWVPIGRSAMRDLDRYLRARRRHKHAGSPYLWLGVKGHLSGSGMAQMLERRCIEAGLQHLHLHQFRHTFCHQWMLQGGDILELARMTGWSSTQMAARYGASAATERAHLSHGRLSPGDLV